jgi:hypothetical protein
VHPHCPCSRATVDELAGIVARCERLAVRVVAVKPAGVPDRWEQTSLLASARKIPGADVLVDSDGAEAAAFGAQTSGHAQLYSSAGALLFSGGITAARGHAGDNAGEDAIVKLVNASAADTRQTPVFGCPLASPSSPSSSSSASSNQTCATGAEPCQR